MALANSAHHTRSHSILLLQKLLNLRDGASPLTLVIDSLEQPAHPVLSEFVSRAKIAKTLVIFLSFATLKKPQDVDIFVKAAGKDLNAVRRDLVGHYPVFNPQTAKDKPTQRAVVIVDSLNALASAAPQSLASFLSSIITPAVSIVATYHDDVPIVLPKSFSEYEPHPFTILCHLATAILRLSSLYQEIERQKARNRSIQEPEWGLGEGREGLLVGLKGRRKDNGDDSEGVVMHMELRRRSGRTVSEKFILIRKDDTAQSKSLNPGKVCLLTDHPMFKPHTETGEAGEGEETPESLMLCASADDEAAEASLAETKQNVRQVLRKLTRNSEAQASIETSKHTVHYLIDSDIVFLAICASSYPRKLAFTYLADLAREFTTVYPAQQVHSPSLRPYAFMEFDNFISKSKVTYADARAAQNLDKLNDELRDVTKVMTKNIEDLLYRGDSLERMGELSSRLRDDSKKYRKAAVRINWELLMKQYGPFAGLGLFILFFIYWRFF
ncbi:transporter sec22 [Mariannaea sp. PMI_226]|nr:transporter sec22 [Mariannaea sp. PMI_226]